MSRPRVQWKMWSARARRQAGPWLAASFLVGVAVAASGQGATSQEDTPEKKKVPTFTDEDLRRYSEERQREEPAPATGPEDFDDESAPPEADPEAPRETEEQYWRRRARDAHEAVRRAGADLEQARESPDRPERSPVRQPLPSEALELDPDRQITRSQASLDRETAIEKAEEALAEAQQALEDLQEEGRRAGALPGWLREG